MEWKPESITGGELEKKQSDYLRMLMEMAKKAKQPVTAVPAPAPAPESKPAPSIVIEKPTVVVEIAPQVNIDVEKNINIEKKLNVSKTIEINAVLDIDGEDAAEEELEEEIIEDIEEELAVGDDALVVPPEPEEEPVGDDALVVPPEPETEEEHIEEIIEEENEVVAEEAPCEEEPCECDKPARKRISSEPPNFENFVKEHNRRAGRSTTPGRPSSNRNPGAERCNTQGKSNVPPDGSFSWQDFKKN